MSMLDDLFSALGGKEGKAQKEDGARKRLRYAGMYGERFSDEYGEKKKQSDNGTENPEIPSLQK